MMKPNDEQERTTPFPGPHGRGRPGYKFTQEELQVLRQCNKESFLQRCIPLGTILGAATYYAVKTGSLSANKRFGALPKVTAAVAVGYFLGKFSYHEKCAEKFMALPNSKVGHLIRARRSGFYDDTDPSVVPNITLSPFTGVADSYSDIPPSSGSYDYDTRPPSAEGLDDSFRPSVDNPILVQEEELPAEQKHVTSYDELRQKNREEYDKKRLAIYKETKLPKTSANPPPPRSSSSSDFVSEDYKPPAAPTRGKNKYGDSWE